MFLGPVRFCSSRHARFVALSAGMILNSRIAVDLRIDAGFIVPVIPAGALTGHSLLVTDERIVAIVPAAAADAQYVAAQTVALPSHVLIPGLVNAHTHGAMSLLRGIADDVPLQPWLQDHIWPREARFVHQLQERAFQV